MSKKSIFVKILLLLILFVSSFGMYACYGVVSKDVYNGLDVNYLPSTLGESFLEEHTILLDDKLNSNNPNYNSFNSHVSYDNGLDSTDVTIDSVKNDYMSYFDNMGSGHQQKDLKYYAYNNQDPTSFTTNTSAALKDIDSNKKIKKQYQWYLTLKFDKDGNLSVENGTSTAGWKSSFYFYNEYYFENFYDSTVAKHLTFNNPKNMTVIYAIRKDIPLNSSLNIYFGKKGSLPQTLIQYASIIGIAVSLIVLFIPNKEMELIQPFTTLKKTKFGTLVLSYMIIAYMWITVMLSAARKGILGMKYTNVFQNLQLTFKAQSILNPFVNIIGWMVFYSFIIFLVFYIKRIYTLGAKRFIKENTIIYWFYSFFKRRATNLSKMDLSDNVNKPALKYSICLGIISIIIPTLMYILYHSQIHKFISFNQMTLIILFVFVVVTVIAFLIIKKNLLDIQNDYSILLDATRRLSNGEFSNHVSNDLGLFNPIKDEFNQINDAFKNAVSREVSSQKMKTELISNVSHDLKTPLTTIISYVELLQSQDLSEEERKKYLVILDDNAIRLKTLIEDLFEVSKVNSGNVKIDLKEVDLVALMKQIIFEYQEKFEEKDLIVKDTYSKQQIKLLLDSEKTYRITTNLLHNVYKYAMEHTRVYIDVVEKENNVILVIKNISKYEIKGNPMELTERFAQGDNSRNQEGSGLGLAIARSFTELQNGVFHIEVDGDVFKVIIIFTK
ncbi:MAG: HAMP domain-containing sensor histidine kinase [Thomasclavelia sp.]|nr:HAMP domain-containing sensor histidine kinase [Thomasclavelia sp.]